MKTRITNDSRFRKISDLKFGETFSFADRPFDLAMVICHPNVRILPSFVNFVWINTGTASHIHDSTMVIPRKMIAVEDNE